MSAATKLLAFLLAVSLGCPIVAGAASDAVDLEAAAESGDMVIVEQLLRAHPDLAKTKDQFGCPVLAVAASRGHAEVVRALLAAGADVDDRNGWGETPLFLAAREGHARAVGLLLDHRADVNAQSRVGTTPLHEALYNEREDVSQLLLAKMPEIDIFAASALGKIEVVRALIMKHPEVVNRPDPAHEEPPLCWAARAGQAEVVRLLVERGAAVEGHGRTMFTALDWAAWRGRDGIVQMLLAAGAHIEMDHWTLHLAVAGGSRGVVELLLTRGADVDSRAAFSDTPLHWAAAMGRTEICEVLLARGASVEAKAWHFESLFHSLTRGDGMELRALAEGLPAWTSLATDDLETPIAWAAEELPEAKVRQLREEAGMMFIPGVNLTGYTPLHWASHMGQTAVARLLLERGAAVNATDPLGETALHWAARGGHDGVAQLLLANGADVRAAAGVLGTPLHWAARVGQQGVGEILLGRGADLSALDGNGRTALHLAAFYGRTTFAGMLIDSGAEVASRDANGQTPLGLATKRQRAGVAQLLRQRGAVE